MRRHSRIPGMFLTFCVLVVGRSADASIVTTSYSDSGPFSLGESITIVTTIDPSQLTIPVGTARIMYEYSLDDPDFALTTWNYLNAVVSPLPGNPFPDITSDILLTSQTSGYITVDAIDHVPFATQTFQITTTLTAIRPGSDEIRSHLAIVFRAENSEVLGFLHFPSVSGEVLRTVVTTGDGNGEVPEPASLIVWSLLGVVGAGVAWRRSRRASIA